MRVKQLWNYVPLPQSLRLVWDRLTFSGHTTIYFVVALVHCFIQVVFQISALHINQDATHILAQISATDPNGPPTGYEVLTKNGPLRACTGISCHMVWSGRVAPDAFEGDPQYPYNRTNEDRPMVTSPASSFSTALVSSSAQSSTLTPASTIVVIVSNIAVQPQATTTVPALSLSPTATLRSSATPSLTFTTSSVTTAPFTSSVSVPAIVTSLASPAGSPSTTVGPARSRRMYIPEHIPGSKTHTFSKRDITITPVFSQPNSTFQGVKLKGLSAGNYDGSNKGARGETNEAFVSRSCVYALQWPLQRLWDTQREDVVFIGFQFWVLGMSIAALLNESVPHIIAAFLTHLLATGWSAFQITHTTNFRSEFSRLTTHGACGGVNLLPTYWKARANAEIPVLVLNVVVLVASAYISWKLLKTFGWLTFKRVGACLEINRIYRVVLCLAIVLQLSLFFMVVSMALWIQELYIGPAAKVTSMAPLYKTVVAIQVVALGPWLGMGWYAVRREMRKTMIAFIVLSVLFIAAWAGMFASPTWRLTFLTWMFFRIVSVSAAILTILSLGLGIICLLNFGKDLPKHLRINEDLEGADFEPAQPSHYSPEHAEKVEFPAQDTYPSFSAAFPSHANSIMSGHSRTHSESTHSRSGSGGSIAPRVVAHPSPYQNFEVQRPMSTATTQMSVHDAFEHDLARVISNNTYSTIRSVGSGHSVDVAPTTGSMAATGMGKRWFIE